MTGVLAITPQTRKWKFMPSNMSQNIKMVRTQLPLLPQKQCTLHGLQSKTVEAAFIVHWIFPPRLNKKLIWLTYSVNPFTPRNFQTIAQPWDAHPKSHWEYASGRNRQSVAQFICWQNRSNENCVCKGPSRYALACPQSLILSMASLSKWSVKAYYCFVRHSAWWQPEWCFV